MNVINWNYVGSSLLGFIHGWLQTFDVKVSQLLLSKTIYLIENPFDEENGVHAKITPSTGNFIAFHNAVTVAST